MLEQDIIQPSTSPWCNPVLLVRKPDGTDRFFVDFRKVNSVTKKDSHPLPRIAETLDLLNGTQFMSSIDFGSGYWQISMDASKKEKTEFISHDGLYEFNFMAFGLCNARSCFQRHMGCVLRGQTWTMSLIYLDDVLVYSRTFDAHLEHLRLVLDRFREATLKLKPSLGYLLGQVQNGREVVIAYGGRKLLPAEKNYSVIEREALAVVSGIKHYQHYLYGAHFKVLLITVQFAG